MVQTYNFNTKHESVVLAHSIPDVYNYELDGLYKKESVVAFPRMLDEDFKALAIKLDKHIMQGKQQERFWSYEEALQEIQKLTLTPNEQLAAEVILDDMRVLSGLKNDEQDIHFVMVKSYNKQSLYQFHNDAVARRAMCQYYGNPTEWIFYSDVASSRGNIYTPKANAIVHNFPIGTIFKFDQRFIHRANNDAKTIPNLLLVANL